MPPQASSRQCRERMFVLALIKIHYPIFSPTVFPTEWVTVDTKLNVIMRCKNLSQTSSLKYRCFIPPTKTLKLRLISIIYVYVSHRHRYSVPNNYPEQKR